MQQAVARCARVRCRTRCHRRASLGTHRPLDSSLATGNRCRWRTCTALPASVRFPACCARTKGKGKGSTYSITERRVPELIPILGSQPAGDVSHKPSGRLPLVSARSAVTLATLKKAATNFAA